MELTNQVEQATTFFTMHPESFHIFWFAVIFILNFLISRYLSLQLIKNGYVLKHPFVIVINHKNKKPKRKVVFHTGKTTEDYKRLFILWFVPVVGACGLLALYITCTTARTLVAIKQKLFLTHI